MTPRLFLAFVVLLAPLMLGMASPAPRAIPSTKPTLPAEATAVAPADAYFGPFGMSPLSIRSSIGFLGRQYHQRTISDHDLLHKALLTEDALRTWRRKYPGDPWLPPTFFHLEQLYQAVQTDEARKHATDILNDVVHTYPKTKEGHLSRARLAAGFPALLPETPVVAAASPTPGPADSASAQPTTETTPVAAPAPPTAPTPLSSPGAQQR